jgi:hypothetical protein
MSLGPVYTLPLGGINVGLAAVIPLLSQVDLLLAGSFGLGPLLADLSLQLNASVSFGLSLGLSISNPLEDLEAQLTAVISLVAAISASLALGLPQVSVELSASIAATASITAALGLQVGGISALIEATLAVKLPIVSLLANLSAGPFVLIPIGFESASTLASAGADFQALTTAPLGSPAIDPGDQVWGVIMLTKVPSASVALSAIMLTH